MLNASMNSSNPSISAHKNRKKGPMANQMRIVNSGVSSIVNRNHSSSKLTNFNNTQKICIDNHLDCSDPEPEREVETKPRWENYRSNVQKNGANSNKFRLMVGNSIKDSSTKYSDTGKKVESSNVSEYNCRKNSTPSRNSKPFYKSNVKQGNDQAAW